MKAIDQKLTDAIAFATRKAVEDLFSAHEENFYYLSLFTTGEGLSPLLSAWSIEALERTVAGSKNPNSLRDAFKWSYSDSPYFLFGERYFEEVSILIKARPRISSSMSNEEWANEVNIRLEAMEAALCILDSEGLFGDGAKRHGIVINAELMPPDFTNTQRAIRLNPPEALKDWLKEAAEE
jgi:hypothetical protein